MTILAVVGWILFALLCIGLGIGSFVEVQRQKKELAEYEKAKAEADRKKAEAQSDAVKAQTEAQKTSIEERKIADEKKQDTAPGNIGGFNATLDRMRDLSQKGRDRLY